MRIILGSLSGDPLMAPLGSSRLPVGHIRLYHYTRANPEVIRREGLKISKARGRSYGEPDMVWASNMSPDPQDHIIVEFSIPAYDSALDLECPSKYRSIVEWSSRTRHVGIHRDIHPSEILQVHEPWHYWFRAYSEEPRYLAMILDGEMDTVIEANRSGTESEVMAMRHIKKVYGRRR